MPNHYHLIVKCGKNLVSIFKFMQGLGIAYVLYFNRQHNKIGRLFQGPFQIRQISGVRDLNTMISYIKHNPLEAELVGGSTAESYRWYYLRSTTPKKPEDKAFPVDEQMINQDEV